MARVAFQGERGAYGDEAVLLHFGPDTEPVPCRSFADVFAAVARAQVDFGLVPVENSQAGSINEVYDLLRQYDLFVISERVLEVNHCLLALPGQDLAGIHRVFSHPQALAQCDAFLRDLGAEILAQYDTAGSAKMIREGNLTGTAAVASRRAAEIYQLDVLAENIQTVKDNYTRFLVLGQEPAPRREGPQKTAIVMATAHQPGCLWRALGCLAERGINVLKIESRPSRNRAFEYVFYLDFEGHRLEANVAEAMAAMAAYTTFLKVLGSFSRDNGF